MTTLLAAQAGQTLSVNVRVPLPAGRAYFQDNDVSVVGALQAGPRGKVLTDLSPHLSITRDGADILVHWSMTGPETAALSSGYFDLVLSDPDFTRARFYPVARGLLTVIDEEDPDYTGLPVVVNLPEAPSGGGGGPVPPSALLFTNGAPGVFGSVFIPSLHADAKAVIDLDTGQFYAIARSANPNGGSVVEFPPGASGTDYPTSRTLLSARGAEIPAPFEEATDPSNLWNLNVNFQGRIWTFGTFGGVTDAADCYGSFLTSSELQGYGTAHLGYRIDWARANGEPEGSVPGAGYAPQNKIKFQILADLNFGEDIGYGVGVKPFASVPGFANDPVLPKTGDLPSNEFAVVQSVTYEECVEIVDTFVASLAGVPSVSLVNWSLSVRVQPEEYTANANLAELCSWVVLSGNEEFTPNFIARSPGA